MAPRLSFGTKNRHQISQPVIALTLVIALVSLGTATMDASAKTYLGTSLPNRTECRTPVSRHWDKGFQVASKRKAIYESRISDLQLEIDKLRNQPVWDVPVLRNIAEGSAAAKAWSDALLGIKAAASLAQTALSSLAEASGQGWAATAVDAGAMQAEWVAKQLRDGNTTIEGIISSAASKEYAAFASKKVVASLDPVFDVNILIVDSLIEGFQQEKEFRQYVGELNRQISNLEREILRTKKLLDEQEMRVRDIVERGSTAYCKNEAPIAIDDVAQTEGREYVDIYVLANDKDPEALELRLVSIGKPQGGRASLNDNGTPGISSDDFIRFAALEGFHGEARFTYEVIDDLGLRSSATVRITVNRRNAAPSYRPQTPACKLLGTC